MRGMVSDEQVRRLLKLTKTEKTLATTAANENTQELKITEPTRAPAKLRDLKPIRLRKKMDPVKFSERKTPQEAQKMKGFRRWTWTLHRCAHGCSRNSLRFAFSRLRKITVNGQTLPRRYQAAKEFREITNRRSLWRDEQGSLWPVRHCASTWRGFPSGGPLRSPIFRQPVQDHLL